jgi:hypothetical protein
LVLRQVLENQFYMMPSYFISAEVSNGAPSQDRVLERPVSSVRSSKPEVDKPISELGLTPGVSHDDQSADIFARCFAYLRELRALRMSQEMAGSLQ